MFVRKDLRGRAMGCTTMEGRELLNAFLEIENCKKLRDVMANRRRVDVSAMESIMCAMFGRNLHSNVKMMLRMHARYIFNVPIYKECRLELREAHQAAMEECGYTQYVNAPTTQKPEETKMALEIKSVTYVNSTDIKTLSDSDIVKIIMNAKQEIDSLEVMPVRPKRIEKKLEQLKADLETFTKLIDELE